MDDFITLTCPSCGGKLEVGKNTSVLKCEHCGIEHMVRREEGAVTLESYARCPMCGRNDRVEKVTSILRSQKQEINTREQRTSAYYDSEGKQRTSFYYVPVTNTQMSNLAKYLNPPTRPKSTPRPRLKSENRKNILLILGIILIVIFLCTLPIFLLSSSIINNSDSNQVTSSTLCCISPIIISLVLGIILVIISNKNKDKIRDKNKIAKKDNELLLKEWRIENQKIQKRWQAANNRWEHLYFCYRDDCVFIPNEGTYAPVDQMRSYLKKN